MNSTFKLNLSSFCFSLVICACENHWLPQSHRESPVKYLQPSWVGLAELQDLFWPGSKTPAEKCAEDSKFAQCPTNNAKKKKKLLRNWWSRIGLELHLGPLESLSAVKAGKMDTGLSCVWYTCPSSAGDQGPLLVRGRVAEAR